MRTALAWYSFRDTNHLSSRIPELSRAAPAHQYRPSSHINPTFPQLSTIRPHLLPRHTRTLVFHAHPLGTAQNGTALLKSPPHLPIPSLSPSMRATEAQQRDFRNLQALRLARLTTTERATHAATVAAILKYRHSAETPIERAVRIAYTAAESTP